MVIIVPYMVSDLINSHPFLARMLVYLNKTENKKRSKASVEFCSTHQSFSNSPCFLISVCAFSLSAGRPTEGPSASAEALLMPVLEGKCYVIIYAFFLSDIPAIWMAKKAWDTSRNLGTSLIDSIDRL